jgi:hypothetical protein
MGRPNQLFLDIRKRRESAKPLGCSIEKQKNTVLVDPQHAFDQVFNDSAKGAVLIDSPHHNSNLQVIPQH